MTADKTVNLGIPIVAIVLGVGKDEALLTRYDDTGVRTLTMPINWTKDHEMQCWSPGYLGHVRQAGLRMLGDASGLITGAMPGADLVVADEYGHQLAPLVHYRAVMKSGIFEDVMSRMDSEWEVFQAFGGANVAGFQPLFQLALYEKLWKSEFQSAKRIMTLADHQTLAITGKFMRDRVMARCQGLDTYESLRLIARVTGSQMSPLIGSPEELQGKDSILPLRDGKGWMMPFTHDSTWARKVIEALFKMWSGGWGGWTIDLAGLGMELDLAKIFAAKGAIEGVGDTQAVIGNIAMIGPVYTELKERSGQSYGGFARLISPSLPWTTGPMVKLDSLTTDAQADADRLCRVYGDEIKAGAAVVESGAKAFAEGLKNAAAALGLDEPDEAGIFGGWAENEPFREGLARYGVKTTPAPFATKATEDTIAAEVYRRYSNQNGQAISFQEALWMIHRVRGLGEEKF